MNPFMQPSQEQENAYQKAVDDALCVMRKWLAAGNTIRFSRLRDAYDMPKSCPLWKMGLSFAQANAILGQLRWEVANGKKYRKNDGSVGQLRP